jgi:hydroxyethylthiazole kinase-like uncharacterized protein yjeF
MLKILNVEQIRKVDAATIQKKPIDSVDLMENAAKASLEKTLEIFPNLKKVLILCGNGNNGGDGLAIARMMLEKNIEITCLLLENEKYSSDNLLNQQRLSKAISPSKSNAVFETIHAQSKKDYFDQDFDLIIDAILGSGLNKPVEGFIEELIIKINTHKSPKIAIDIPSGLMADQIMPDKAIAVKATHTITFQLPKLAFFFAEGYTYTGHWHLVDIGLLQESIQEADSKKFFITRLDAQALLKPRAKFSHKGTFGHALLFAGSKGKAGAATIAAKACLRSGVGLLSCYVPKAVLPVLQHTISEAMCLEANEQDYISGLPDLQAYDAIAIGPGIGMEKETAQCLKSLIQQSKVPMVFDADALNLLAENPTWLSFLPPLSILTPHPKEFERLAGKCSNSFESMEKALAFSFKYNCILLMKSAFSYVVLPDGKIYFNSTGNPGMAKGGSGDALTGIILALLSNGYPPNYAAILAMYLHGLAGDLTLTQQSVESMLVSDLIENLGEAFKVARG